MSLSSLASSFANTYVNAPADAPHLRERSVAMLGAAGAAAALTAPAPPPPPAGDGGGGGGGGAAAPTAGAALGANLKALTDYIPSEILTLYIGAIAAIEAWPFKNGTAVLAGDALSAARVPYLYWTFIGCLIAAPLWVAIGVVITSKTRPGWQPFVWPMIAATVAFFAYAMAIPKSWLADAIMNGGLFATMTLLLVTPLLHTGTLLYTKLFPPPPPPTP